MLTWIVIVACLAFLVWQVGFDGQLWSERSLIRRLAWSLWALARDMALFVALLPTLLFPPLALLAIGLYKAVRPDMGDGRWTYLGGAAAFGVAAVVASTVLFAVYRLAPAAIRNVY